MYIRIQQDCTLQVSILGNSRQDIEDVCSKYDCSKVGCLQSGRLYAIRPEACSKYAYSK